MSFCQFSFQAVTHFVRFVLTFVNIVTQSLFTFAVTNLAGTVDHGQRAHNMVVAVLHATFALVRHVAIGTRYAALCVDTHHRQLIIRMLCFQDRSTAQLMCIVCETFFIIISFHIFHGEPFVPRESQVFAIPFEVIFYMALCTNQRTHFLLGSFRNITSLTLECFDQSRTADLQVHCSRLVAIGTTDRVHDLVTHSRPFCLIEIIHADSLHHTGNIRTFTSPAGSRLRAFFGCHRRTDTQSMTHIIYRMHMSAGSRIIFGEGISCPQDHHFGTGSQYVDRLISVILTLETGIHRLCPCVIFTRIVRLELFVHRLDPCDFHLLIIHNTGDLRPPFVDRSGQYTQYKNDYHCSGEQ